MPRCAEPVSARNGDAAIECCKGNSLLAGCFAVIRKDLKTCPIGATRAKAPTLFARTVPAGLKTRYPGLKSGAGTGRLKRLRKKSAPGRKANTSGTKALIFAPFTARLKSCPDTKHEFFRSL
jgi:hypothetical protein